MNAVLMCGPFAYAVLAAGGVAFVCSVAAFAVSFLKPPLGLMAALLSSSTVAVTLAAAYLAFARARGLADDAAELAEPADRAILLATGAEEASACLVIGGAAAALPALLSLAALALALVWRLRQR